MNKLKILFLSMSIFLVSCVTCFAYTDNYEYYVNLKYNQIIYFNTYEISGEKVVFRNSQLVSDGVPQTVMNYSSKISDMLSTNNFDLSKDVSIDYINNGEIIPPTIAPTVQGAIQEIVPTFSNQLVEFLPIGITILVILLGVQLIPRLVAWFQ